MAGDDKDADDKTEAATPQHLEKARLEGNVALSREAVQLASLGGAALGLAMTGPEAGRALVQASAVLFAGSHVTDAGEAATALLQAAAPAALGVAALAAAGAVAATLAQTRMLVSTAQMMPKLSKISPLAGLKRMFGLQAAEELLRTMVKLGGVGLALWWQAEDVASIMAALSHGVEDLTGSLATRIGGLLTAALAALAGIAAFDLLWTRLRHARRMRMTREDVKDENKQAEGDPHLRARRMQIMRSRSRRRTLAAVAKATVVVTNPTHYAVALAYERGRDAAPRVVARGVDELAARMRRAAEDAGVPIIPNPPLARALYRLPEEAQIPAEHFKAVAEIIALVWRLRNPAR
ncbi:EscU/YscU/HrcU family type III secretion system export apparatus switch protein [Roseomonas frigidaquae]|uniref:EscU/YscU/HrcU family type III secretion system export apparatus switch protein n=1 Tax=Falsiroseomonas frigidaquae TaxID=487318 RepID=A0ABX1EVT0_9PROT|nr:EscU/YscU/HrcU family type III secretion system export apparatus switch protein [Falsiroseomonas frigidaquae]NKE43295.1 EscU/YscU/HrcU family type III secretion system export apparatus switch protein [Falsiroseomonas frigidaquae]